MNKRPELSDFYEKSNPNGCSKDQYDAFVKALTEWENKDKSQPEMSKPPMGDLRQDTRYPMGVRPMESQGNELKQDTRVQYNINDKISGEGKVCGIVASNDPSGEKVYIVQPDAPINNEGYGFSHFAAYQSQLKIVGVGFRKQDILNAIFVIAKALGCESNYKNMSQSTMMPVLTKMIVQDMFLYNFNVKNCTSEQNEAYDLIHSYYRELETKGFVDLR